VRGVGFEPTQAFASRTSLQPEPVLTWLGYLPPLSWLGHPRKPYCASQAFNFFVLVFMYVLTLFLMASLGDLRGRLPRGCGFVGPLG